MANKDGGNKGKMSDETQPPSQNGTENSSPTNVVTEAKIVLKEALTASLATTHHETNTPYASLVSTAFEPDGAPILLISNLAIHTKNLKANPSACLLFQQIKNDGNPIEAGRLSLWGNFEKTTSDYVKQRFIARHPSAEVYMDFDDFGFYRLKIEAAHFVGGFGRIKPLTSREISTDCEGAEELLDLEHGFLVHLNRDHKQTIQDIATNILKAPAGEWKITGLDPEGLDFVDKNLAYRLQFDAIVKTPEEMKSRIELLANNAKQAHGHDHNHDHGHDHHH